MLRCNIFLLTSCLDGLYLFKKRRFKNKPEGNNITLGQLRRKCHGSKTNV